MTKPLLAVGQFVIHSLGHTMVNLFAKSEVSTSRLV